MTAPAPASQTTHIHTDCRTDEGITVGLIEGIISSLRILRQRGVSTVAELEAMRDLQADESLRWLLSMTTTPHAAQAAHAHVAAAGAIT